MNYRGKAPPYPLLTRKFPQENLGSQRYKIIFSESEFSIPANVSWPNWVVDRPPEGRQISKNQPLCSIIVDYESSDDVVNLLQHYALIVKNHLLSGL